MLEINSCYKFLLKNNVIVTGVVEFYSNDYVLLKSNQEETIIVKPLENVLLINKINSKTKTISSKIDGVFVRETFLNEEDAKKLTAEAELPPLEKNLENKEPTQEIEEEVYNDLGSKSVLRAKRIAELKKIKDEAEKNSLKKKFFELSEKKVVEYGYPGFFKK